MAQQIARAAGSFEQERTGHAPKSVSVVLSEDTLVIALRGALSPAEVALANSPSGAAQLQEFHRQLFAKTSHPRWQEIKRITGVSVRELAPEGGTGTGGAAPDPATGTVVQVLLLARSVPEERWSGSWPEDPSVRKEQPCWS